LGNLEAKNRAGILDDVDEAAQGVNDANIGRA